MRTIRFRAAASVMALCVVTTPAVHGKQHAGAQVAAPTGSTPAVVQAREPMPVVIVAQPPAPEGERRAQEVERAQKTASDAALVKWTEVLGVATLVLACSTLALWWATRRLVLGAEATAERQLRSYLFVEILIERIAATTPYGNVSLALKLRVANHGTTPAILTKISAISLFNDGPPRAIPNSPGADHEAATGIAIGPNGTYEVDVPVVTDPFTLVGPAAEGRSHFCCGVVSYEDVLGLHRETGFCWHYMPAADVDRFAMTPGTPLNYRT